ncbi:RNA methyltransferase [bacterium (Candidatus Blackallbacteria) CG17_big_fil_post_rev_8_21_14_2_50_48_46]|uniref:RNA methyltransferase n=1 Tax=bacterium (Candidatus Blackallbacteria) CG17_big_fil_post_rev_8_21_14_2_50_48_46 TaxID=2014261 RepID=A0A2M7G910_9BACT|nr:MAG: RNA methyltransferase [bacterium (Candidatus Blackallbacteria) CG18_big_fil_WC_8_21_14_2_50_49_26]PIW18583.1 MAG: RNA methyltransferase [bacterium (Candidatus Blackallbacteria) CG17_big_fil_post_rev_8_21_14_2_50_48_46]PIW46431.1 MAG: RNA methyltransferase [bacterium (Candidatus Blackallbacteria) CG13_big_fil_rev_8_21_14_2_50_49_14]
MPIFNTPQTLVAACSFGLEALVSEELRNLGIEILQTENGKVRFRGGQAELAKALLWLRTADRIGIELASFPAENFDELFDQTCALPWEDWLPPDAVMHITGRSHKSKLFSVRDCQALVKKALIKAMQRKYKLQTFPEDGALYKIEISMLNDQATLMLDTTGPSLHKRGYRSDAGEAPLKETLAAALVLLSRWEPSRILCDPCCGSGTIAIEAALIGLNRAPGLKRKFTAETWPEADLKLWKTLRTQAQEQELPGDFRILASDSDSKVLRKARQNAQNAGVSDQVAIQTLNLSEFRSRKKYGVLITNPPYGERIGEKAEVLALYKDLKALMDSQETWSWFVLSADHGLETAINRQASKRRKLFNGKIPCQYFQFFGPFPSRHDFARDEA